MIPTRESYHRKMHYRMVNKFVYLLLACLFVVARGSLISMPTKTFLESKISECEGNWGTGDCIPNNWDVSQITDMSKLFEDNTAFNEPINNWDVSSVTTMYAMFHNARSFNQPLNDWDVSSVTNMESMFEQARSFNQPLNDWDVKAVTTIRRMFFDARSFDQTISCWVLRSLRNGPSDCIEGLFDWSGRYIPWRNLFTKVWWRYYNPREDGIPAKSLTHTINLPNLPWPGWGKPWLTFWSGGHKAYFQNPFGGSCVLRYTRINRYIKEAAWGFWNIYSSEWVSEFKISDLNNNTCPNLCNSTTYGRSSGGNCEPCPDGEDSSASFNEVCEPCPYGFYRSSDMERCAVFTNDDYTRGISTDKRGIVDCAAGETSKYNKNLTCCPQNMPFWNIYSSSCNAKEWIPTKTLLQEKINNCMGKWGNVNCVPNKWDVSQITEMRHLFEGNTAFNEPINDWDMSSVTDVYKMFKDATSFNQPLNDWNVSSVTNMQSMFERTTSFNQPLNDWDVSSVTNMQSMFERATSFTQPLNDWNMSSVTNVHLMFKDATAFDQPINNWDLSSVTGSYGMFRGAASFSQNIPALTTIGEYAFAHTPLRSITIPSTVTEIQPYAFENSLISSVTFESPSSISRLSKFSFANMIALTEITLPSSITYIQADAFSGCASFKTVNYEGAEPTIETRAFPPYYYEHNNIDSLSILADEVFGGPHTISDDGLTIAIRFTTLVGTNNMEWFNVYKKVNGIWIFSFQTIRYIASKFGKYFAIKGNAIMRADANEPLESGAWWILLNDNAVSDAVTGDPYQAGLEVFGHGALSDDGQTFVLGAPTTASNNGLPAASYPANSISIYKMTNGVWGKASQWWGSAGDKIGESVAISGDGLIVAVGAPSAYTEKGYVVVFFLNNDGTYWKTSTINNNFGTVSWAGNDYDRFGHSVALSYDGSALVIGQPGYDSNSWNQGRILVAKSINYNYYQYYSWSGYSGSRLGTSVAISNNFDDGRWVVSAGGPDYQKGWVICLYFDQNFQKIGHRDIHGDSATHTQFSAHKFGTSVALANNGRTLDVGSKSTAFYIKTLVTSYTQDTSLGDYTILINMRFLSPSRAPISTILTWLENDSDTAKSERDTLRYQMRAARDDAVGPHAISDDGLTLVVNTPERDSLEIYKKNEAGEWNKTAVLYGTYARVQFGSAVAISGDGLTIVGSGPEYNSDMGYVMCAKLDATGQILSNSTLLPFDQLAGTEFGYSLDLNNDGSALIVGEPGYNSGVGRASIYQYSSANGWTRSKTTTPIQIYGRYGTAVAITGECHDNQYRIAVSKPEIAFGASERVQILSLTCEQPFNWGVNHPMILESMPILPNFGSSLSWFNATILTVGSSDKTSVYTIDKRGSAVPYMGTRPFDMKSKLDTVLDWSNSEAGTFARFDSLHLFNRAGMEVDRNAIIELYTSRNFSTCT